MNTEQSNMGNSGENTSAGAKGFASLFEGVDPATLNGSPLEWAAMHAARARAMGEIKGPDDLPNYRKRIDDITRDAAQREALRRVVDALMVDGWGPGESIAGGLHDIATELRAVAEVLESGARHSWCGMNDTREDRITEARKRIDAVRANDVFDLAAEDPSAA